MVRKYSILSTNGELQTSPYVNKIQKNFDILLTVNKTQVVNFLLQFPVERTDIPLVKALYDKNSLELEDLKVENFKNQTILSAALTAKEIGSLEIDFTIPFRSRVSKNSLGTVTIEC